MDITNGRTKNQIDHTMIAKEYRSSIMDDVVRRGGPDVGSDHYLVETRLKLKMKRIPREMKGRTRLDTQKLADEEMLVKYNRFQALKQISSPGRVGRRRKCRPHEQQDGEYICWCS